MLGQFALINNNTYGGDNNNNNNNLSQPALLAIFGICARLIKDGDGEMRESALCDLWPRRINSIHQMGKADKRALKAPIGLMRVVGGIEGDRISIVATPKSRERDASLRCISSDQFARATNQRCGNNSRYPSVSPVSPFSLTHTYKHSINRRRDRAPFTLPLLGRQRSHCRRLADAELDGPTSKPARVGPARLMVI